MQNALSTGDGATGGPSSGVRLLRHSDLAGLMRLKEAANWNQTQADCEQVLELEPDGCFGVEQEGVLAASATALTYGHDLAWIGMVLTLPEFRKRGLGSLLLQRTLEFCEHRGVAQAGLDATDMGLPIYERFGFEAECIIERWERPANPGRAEPVAVEGWQPTPELDQAAFGADRSRLLARLAGFEAASLADVGYAMGRPGSRAVYFGPCVAKSGAAAETLLQWFLARHSNELIYWDLLADNAEAVALAREHGFRVVRKLTRMRRKIRAGGSARPWNNVLVFAIAGFEIG